jgi:hypothetical protein
MGKEPMGLGISPVITRINLDIEQYEGLLQSSLGPKARKMFEHLLARARSELAVIEAEEGPGQPLLAQASGQG